MKILTKTPVHITLIAGRLIQIPCNKQDFPTLSFHFSIAPNLPAGLSLDSATGALCGSPTVCFTPRAYTLVCRGADGTTSSKGITIEVIESSPRSSRHEAAGGTRICHTAENFWAHQSLHRRCTSDPGADVTSHMLAPMRLADLGRTATLQKLVELSVSAKQLSARRLPLRSRSPSLSRCGADAAVLVPLGPRLALALCDGDEARRVLRGRRMGRASFIAAGAALGGPVCPPLSNLTTEAFFGVYILP